MIKPNIHRFILYHVPGHLSNRELFTLLTSSLLAFKSPQSPSAQLGFSAFQPSLVTRSLVVETRHPGTARELLDSGEVLARLGVKNLELCPFEGQKTINAIEHKLKDFVLYITGVPIKVDYELLLGKFSTISKIRELYIPRNSKNNFKYFGFVTCLTSKDKAMLILKRKININSSSKILIKEFDFDMYRQRTEESQGLAE